MFRDKIEHTKKKIKESLFRAFNIEFTANRGYSLIELLVAISIFTIVAMVSISALISINDANKKAQTMRAIIDNLNFAVENMARNLRVGTNFHCGSDTIVPDDAMSLTDGNCSVNGNVGIAFKSYKGTNVAYKLVTNSTTGQGQILRNDGNGWLPISPYIANPFGNFQPLTIDYMKFYVAGTGTTGGNQFLQPRVVIVIHGTARYNDKIQSQFNIQTSISQRKLDS